MLFRCQLLRLVVDHLVYEPSYYYQLDFDEHVVSQVFSNQSRFAFYGSLA